MPDRSTNVIVTGDGKKVLVNGCIGCEFGVKRGSEDAALADKHWMARVFGQNLHIFPYRRNDGGANEDHLEGFGAKLGPALVNVARELPPVTVTQHGNID